MYVKIIFLNRREQKLHVRMRFNTSSGTHRTVIQARNLIKFLSIILSNLDKIAADYEP